MTRERFEEIFDDESIKTEFDGDNAMKGLIIIAKCFDIRTKEIITGASHSEIKSVDIDELIEAGVTEEDVIILKKLNWMIEDDYLACFV